MADQILGTVRCVLCKAVVTFKNADSSKFENHLRVEHAVHFATNIILAVSLMDEEEVEAVINIMFSKAKQTELDEQKQEESDNKNVKIDEKMKVKKEKVTEGEKTITEDSNDVTAETPKETEKKNKEMFTCDICKKMFAWRKSLTMHTNKYHSETAATNNLNEDKEVDLEKSHYFSVNPKVITKIDLETVSMYDVEDEMLPGWKFRTRDSKKSHSDGIRKMKIFLTPKKKRSIKTSLGVLAYMQLQGKPKSQLSKLADHLNIRKDKFEALYSNAS